jgi:hypothetical protein
MATKATLPPSHWKYRGARARCRSGPDPANDQALALGILKRL